MFYPFAVGGGASDPKGSSAPRERPKRENIMICIILHIQLGYLQD